MKDRAFTQWTIAIPNSWLKLAAIAYVVLMLINAYFSIRAGQSLSAETVALAEAINADYVGNMYAFPVEGVNYRLEGRVVGINDWYHDILPARYGDQVEIRLRVATASGEQPVSLSAPSCQVASGLKTINNEHRQIMMPDGSMVDYLPLNSETSYVACGIYEFNTDCWNLGKSSSSLTIDGVSTLYVVSPDGAVNLPHLAFLGIAGFAGFWVLWPKRKETNYISIDWVR